MKKGWKKRLQLLSLLVRFIVVVALIIGIHSYCKNLLKEIKNYKKIKDSSVSNFEKFHKTDTILDTSWNNY